MVVTTHSVRAILLVFAALDDGRRLTSIAKGHKDEEWTAPDGLISQSQADGSDGIVYVALNYRLGAFGFLTGGDDRVDKNAGLLDQRLAFQWSVAVHRWTSLLRADTCLELRIKESIHLFGGDPDNLTVIGESAGGGSLAFHVTANGGKTPPPFKNAILQSIDGRTVDPYDTWGSILAEALKITGRTITSGEELAALSSDDLGRANTLYTLELPAGFSAFGPTIDGDYVQDWPAVHLLKGEYNSSTRLMLSHTANETIAFLAEENFGDDDVNDLILSTLIPQLMGVQDEADIQHLIEDLYPHAGPDTTDMYYTPYGRILLLTSEAAFSCGPNHFARAWGDQTHNWVLDIGRGWHGMDIGYVFYNGSSDSVDAEAAYAIQRYIVQFARTGDPNMEGSGLPEWPVYGEDTNVAAIVEGGAVMRSDIKGKTERCLFWQSISGKGEPFPPS